MIAENVVVNGIYIEKDYKSHDGHWYSDAIRFESIMDALQGFRCHIRPGLFEEEGISEEDQKAINSIRGGEGWDTYEEYVEKYLPEVGSEKLYNSLDYWEEVARKELSKLKPRVTFDDDISTG